MLRQRLGLAVPRGAENIFDLEVQDALQGVPAAEQYSDHRHADAAHALRAQRRQRAAAAAPKPALAGSEAQRLIANMERWRWMPEHLGEIHIWDNIPEFMTRVVKKGQVIHTAKIIVGKPDTPTAVFSANMKYLVFHPEWGVPDSIKVKELAPYLSGGGGFLFFGGGDTSVLTRQQTARRLQRPAGRSLAR